MLGCRAALLLVCAGSFATAQVIIQPNGPYPVGQDGDTPTTSPESPSTAPPNLTGTTNTEKFLPSQATNQHPLSLNPVLHPFQTPSPQIYTHISNYDPKDKSRLRSMTLPHKPKNTPYWYEITTEPYDLDFDAKIWRAVPPDHLPVPYTADLVRYHGTVFTSATIGVVDTYTTVLHGLTSFVTTERQALEARTGHMLGYKGTLETPRLERVKVGMVTSFRTYTVGVTDEVVVG